MKVTLFNYPVKTTENKSLTTLKNVSTVVPLELHDALAHKVIENHTNIREALRIAIKNYIGNVVKNIE